MPKQSRQAYDLSDAEKRDLVQLIQQGKPLPDKYRFILFEDKREVELVWNGKTRDVCTTVLPFQSLEHVDEPRKEVPESPQFGLFDTRGRQIRGWTNKLIWGDNRLILSSLRSGALRQQIEEAGGLKLIYIDPPFDVGADFSMDIEIGEETYHKEPNLLEQIAYRDTWGRGSDSFVAMLYERLVLMRDLLSDDGSLYLHCDWRVTALVRLVLNEIFGEDHYRNEITWVRTSSHNMKTAGFVRAHDTIHFCTKSNTFTFNEQYRPYGEAQLSRYKRDEAGRLYKAENLTFSSRNPNRQFEWRGTRPPPHRSWGASLEQLEKWWQEGRILTRSDGSPRMDGLKVYLDDMKGNPVSTIWDDIARVGNTAEERLDYPTQKPEALLERIIKASSNEGDLVADFFAGSGTTAATAEKLRRRWICADLGKFAVHTTRKRMIQVQRELKQSGEHFRAFEVLNLGRYERQVYLNIGGRLTAEQREEGLAQKEREFRELILRAYRAELLTNESFFHGKTAGRLVVVGPINLPVGRLFVEEVIVECRKRGATRVDVLAFEFEIGLFPAALDEAKQKGIDLAPKYIPSEVFDKRAVDRGQVVFHDVSYVEATPRYIKKNKLAAKIALTDFSVYYSHGTIESVLAELKNGKSQVVCENGQLVKISKDKSGIVTREVLTKHWTDWVDYWAVDFDYMSRKEIIRVPTTAAVGTDIAHVTPGETVEYEERWTGGYIFENEWQSFRTRQNRELELVSAEHEYPRAGRYTVAVKVIDIFGNDTMTLVPVTVG